LQFFNSVSNSLQLVDYGPKLSQLLILLTGSRSLIPVPKSTTQIYKGIGE